MDVFTLYEKETFDFDLDVRFHRNKFPPIHLILSVSCRVLFETDRWSPAKIDRRQLREPLLIFSRDKATRIRIQRRFSLHGRHDEDAGSINHERARSKMQRECTRDRGWQSDYPKLSSGSALSTYAKEETGKNISQTFYEWSCVSVFFFFREITSAAILFSATSGRCLPRQQVHENYVVLAVNV